MLHKHEKFEVNRYIGFQVIKDLMSLMGFSMLTEMDAKPSIGTGGVLLAPFRPNGTFDEKTRDLC